MLDFLIEQKSIEFKKASAFNYRVSANVWIGSEKYIIDALGNTKVEAMTRLIRNISNKQWNLMNEEGVRCS